MNEHHTINYAEVPTQDIEATKQFFADVFGFSFKDFGNDYTAFSDSGLEGGFYRSNTPATTERGSALLVFFSDDLEASEQSVKDAGGKICREIFTFPGGRRFHFHAPGGSEFAVWGK